MKSAIFFDRDGVLNEEVGYLHEVEKFKWIDGAIDSIKFCNYNGILAVVVTNQSGVARGIYTEDDVKKIHSHMQNELKNFGAHIDAFYYCPHHPEGKVTAYRKICDCRKPKPGLILRACRDLNIDPSTSIMIGDGQRDIEAGENAGLKYSLLFNGGNLFNSIKDKLQMKNLFE